MNVKYLKLVDIDLNSETLGQVFDINLEEPYKVFCGRDYRGIGSCSYNLGHHLAFFNHNSCIIYTQNNGSTNDIIDNLQVRGYRQNSGGQTILHPLSFDPATESYNQEDAIELNFSVIGAAGVSCR